MRIMVRKSGEVILGMSELEAVTLQDVINTVQEASEKNPKTFNRTQKAVLRDTYKNLQGLDKAYDEMEKRTSDTEEAVDETSGIKAVIE